MNEARFAFRDDRAATPVMQPRPGTGAQLTSSALGFSYAATDGVVSYRGRFRPALAAQGIRFSRGLVEGREATIGKLPLSDPKAVLALKPGIENAQGESWACLEVVPDAEGRLLPDARREIVHSDSPVSLDPALGRCAIALILWRARRPVQAIAIIEFNLRYERLIPAPGHGPVRHFFL